MVEEYDQAVGRKDREALRNLMGSGFVYFTSSGAVRSRAEFIDFLTSAAYQPESRELLAPGLAARKVGPGR